VGAEMKYEWMRLYDHPVLPCPRAFHRLADGGKEIEGVLRERNQGPMPT
jgi:hypothetical protein